MTVPQFQLPSSIYNRKKGIVCCLQHQAKTISGNTDAYQEEMIGLRHNLHHNNYTESITSAPRNLDRRIEDNIQKLTTVCLPDVKGLAESIQKICNPYDIRTVFTSGSTLRRYLFWVKSPMEFNMIKNGVYSIPCSCSKIYKGETGRKARRTLEGSSTRWDWKVGYGRPYIEGKRDPSALMGWSWNNW